MTIEQGMFAKSKAGHDKDCIYVVISVNDEYVYLADGRIRPVCRPKKKKKKHIQIICSVRCSSVTDDIVIRNEIRQYKKQEM